MSWTMLAAAVLLMMQCAMKMNTLYVSSSLENSGHIFLWGRYDCSLSLSGFASWLLHTDKTYLFECALMKINNFS